MDKLIIVCGWCGKYIGVKKTNQLTKYGKVTHGICPVCFEKVKNKFHKSKCDLTTIKK